MSSSLESDTTEQLSRNGSKPRTDGGVLERQVTRARFWRDAAPKRVSEKYTWKAWAGYLARRRNPKPVNAVCQADGSALRWGLSKNLVSPLGSELLELIATLSHDPTSEKSTKLLQRGRSHLTQWVDAVRADNLSADSLLECLAVAHLLAPMAAVCESEQWWTVLGILLSLVEESGPRQIDADAPTDEALAHQLLLGELALTLAYLFPEIRPLYKLRAVADEALNEGIEQLLDGEGCPRGSCLPVFLPLLACWTRCRAMGATFKKGCWNRRSERQYRQTVTRSLCLSNPKGSLLLQSDTSASWSPDFLAAVIHMGGSAIDKAAAFDQFPRKLTKHLPGKSGQTVPPTSEDSEWSGLAVLRSEYSRRTPLVAVDYSSPELRIDVWNQGQRLLAGVWASETSIDNKSVQKVGTWEQVCWFSDKDVDYLELTIDLANGARLDRQILLARDDLFLFIADYVLSMKGQAVRHHFELPLVDSIQFAPETETREGQLVADKPLARVLPLSLPEWRIDNRFGSLTQTNHCLQLLSEMPVSQLACPLFIDLNPARFGKPCTWRQLTVAAALEIQPRDVAVGYRVQSGQEQWLVYRSLAPSANRTVLGQNTSMECLIGRFLAPSGELEELLQVEGN